MAIKGFYIKSIIKYICGLLVIISLVAFQKYLVLAREPTASKEDTRGDKYHFLSHYAHHSIPLWERVLASYKGKPNIRYLEIGVGEGESTVWMLEHVLTHPSARMTGIDIFPGDLKKRFLANLRASGYAHKAKIITGRSQEALKFLPTKSFDIIYIDGSHMAADVLADAVLSWPLLKNGGFLIFDDYLMSTIKPGIERMPDSLPRDLKLRKPFFPLEMNPKVAVDAFITAHRNNLEVIYRGYLVVVKKLQDDPFLSLGEYRYSWREQKLYDNKNKNVVPLSKEERKVVEQLFLSRPSGETDFQPGEELLNDQNFIELTKRLNLVF